MWTGLILACLGGDPTQCVAVASLVPYATEEDCVAEIPVGLAFITQRYPGTEVVEALCYQ
jgi:hypothetical protein